MNLKPATALAWIVSCFWSLHVAAEIRADFSADDIVSEAESELGSVSDLDEGFRIVFVTNDKTSGNQTDISFYDNFVNSQAAESSSVVKDYQWDWKAIVTTQAVDADDHTGTAGNSDFPENSTENYGLPIFNLRNQLVAENYWKFWKAELEEDIRYDQRDSDGQRYAWTGTKKGKGSDDSSGSYLGSSASNDYKVFVGEARKKSDWIDGKGEKSWAKKGNPNNLKEYGLYAISPILYVVETTPGSFTFSTSPDGAVPEPSTILIIAGFFLIAMFKSVSERFTFRDLSRRDTPQPRKASTCGMLDVPPLHGGVRRFIKANKFF